MVCRFPSRFRIEATISDPVAHFFHVSPLRCISNSLQHDRIENIIFLMHVLPEGGTHAIDQGRNFACSVNSILHGRSGHLRQFIFHLLHGFMFQTQ